MRVIYTAGPYSAPTPEGVRENILRARQVAIEVWKMGAAALCPHMNTATFEMHGISYERFIDGDLEMIRRSDAVLMLEGWEHSPGALMERQEATERCIPVFYTLDDLKLWLNES